MTSKPLKDFRYGPARVTVWLNQTSSGTMYNVSVIKPYLDKSDEWQESNSFSEGDLPALAKAVNDAHSWIYEHKKTNAQTDAAHAPEEQPA